MTPTDEYHICVGCGKRFYKKDLSQRSLQYRRFETFKRCPECRGRKDIRSTPNYWTKRRQRTIDIADLIPIDYDGAIRLVAAAAKTSVNDLLDTKIQESLEAKLLAGEIKEDEKAILKEHYASLIFLMDTWGGCIHFQEMIPIQMLEGFNKHILTMLLPL